MAKQPEPFRPVIELKFRPLSAAERAQFVAASRKDAPAAEVYAALRLGAVDWTGTKRHFSGAVFEEEINVDEARVLLAEHLRTL